MNKSGKNVFRPNMRQIFFKILILNLSVVIKSITRYNMLCNRLVNILGAGYCQVQITCFK